MSPTPHRPARKPRPTRASHLLEHLESRLLLTTYNFATLAALTGGGKTGTGASPQSLAIAPNGDLYGTAAQGGAHGYGLVFEIPANTNTVIPLASFDGKDGLYPRGGIVVDADGNVFGATTGGGSDGKGTLFEVVNGSGAITTLVSFTGPNGSFPLAGISADPDGNLVGVTDGARAGGLNKSTLFRYDLTAGTLTTLATLKPNADPRGGIVVDSAGNIFGTTRRGGANSDGTLFELPNGSGTITTLASFTGPNGTLPDSSLLLDDQGDIFGTTVAGGAHNNGAAFEWFASSSTLTLLASFSNAIGTRPHGNLLTDSDGNLVGVTALGGGHGAGAVWQLTPDGTASVLTQLYALQGSKNGRNPSGPLVIDPSTGTLIGENLSGGPKTANAKSNSNSNGNAISNRGTLFELIPDTNPQTAIKIVVTGSPKSTIAGSTLAPNLTVDVEDIFGNIVSTDNGAVTLQINSGPTTSTLTGTVTVNFVNGVASFPGISIDTAGTYTLTAFDGARTSAPTKPFTISPDVSTAALVFSQQPTDTGSNTTITPAISVSVEDQYNNVIPTMNPAITLSIHSGPIGGALTGGPLKVAASKGKSTFNGLALTLAGTYTLSASAPNFDPITSGAVVVVDPPV